MQRSDSDEGFISVSYTVPLIITDRKRDDPSLSCLFEVLWSVRSILCRWCANKGQWTNLTSVTAVFFTSMA
jgi:hypothetical protein